MKMVIDIDKELLEAVRAKLGASTMKDAVPTALRALLDMGEAGDALEAFEFWRREGSPGLLNLEVMKHAWGRRN
jgi:Arc/MetJ family transcription regulator